MTITSVCTSLPGEQTSVSTITRTSAVVLGITALAIGILLLHQGKSFGWGLIAPGAVSTTSGLVLKQVRVNHDRSEAQIKIFWETAVPKLRHGTNTLFLHHFRQHGISSTYPQPLVEIIGKINQIWEKHESEMEEPRTGYFRMVVERLQAAAKQKIAVSFSPNPNITEEYTRGARLGGEWARETRIFLREANRNWSQFDASEQETIHKVEALLQLITCLPPLILSLPFLQGDQYKNFESFRSYVKQSCPEWQKSDQLQRFLDALQSQYQESNDYEHTIHHPVPADQLEFTLGKREPMEHYEGPFFPFDVPQPINAEIAMRHRILVNGFSLHPAYQDSRFELRGGTVTRRRIQPEDGPEWEKEKARRAYTAFWIEQFHCQEVVRQYNLFL